MTPAPEEVRDPFNQPCILTLTALVFFLTLDTLWLTVSSEESGAFTEYVAPPELISNPYADGPVEVA